MKATALFARPRLPWRWLVDSPLVIAIWVAVVLGARAAHHVDQALGGARTVGERVHFLMARFAAESAANHVSIGDGDGGERRVKVGDVEVTVETVGAELRLACVVPGGQSWHFACARLAGASPKELGAATTSGASLALDPDHLARAFSAEEVLAFRRDAGIALLHLEAGTERDDFVLDGQRLRHGISNAADLVAVPGHLWIEPGEEPLRLWLERDLTVVVRGNLYIGRSLLIDGPGRLVFATLADAQARPFADRDGNGRWSAGDEARAGPIEGASEGGGNAYLGLPRHKAPLVIAAGLVVAGELHLAAAARVDGPVVLGHAMTRIGAADAKLVATGARLFCTERESVPGFLTHGPRRPGLLRQAPGNRAAGRDQPLYLAAPTR